MATGTYMGIIDPLEFNRHLFTEDFNNADLFDATGFTLIGQPSVSSSVGPAVSSNSATNSVTSHYMNQPSTLTNGNYGTSGNVSNTGSSSNATANSAANVAAYAQQFSNIVLPSAAAQLQGPSTSIFMPTQTQATQSAQIASNYYGLQLPSGVTYIPMTIVPQAGATQSQSQVLQLPLTLQTQQGQQGISVQTISPQLLSSMGMVYSLASQPQQIAVQQPIHYQPYPTYQIKTNGITLNGDSAAVASTDDRKRNRAQRSSQRRVRHTRPKVIEAKGAVQCQGRNRKKGTQCRNAALMEYIGPRPIYCAEHIELDPQSLYEKCKSPYQKETGDKKGCKEVVLKEFGLCYKHYVDTAAQIKSEHDIERAQLHHKRITELLEQLENEAAAAKKKDGDLYQRKNKLIPKFQEMKRTISRVLEELGAIPRSQMPASHGDDSTSFGSSPLSLTHSDSEDNSFSTD